MHDPTASKDLCHLFCIYMSAWAKRAEFWIQKVVTCLCDLLHFIVPTHLQFSASLHWNQKILIHVANIFQNLWSVKWWHLAQWWYWYLFFFLSLTTGCWVKTSMLTYTFIGSVDLQGGLGRLVKSYKLCQGYSARSGIALWLFITVTLLDPVSPNHGRWSQESVQMLCSSCLKSQRLKCLQVEVSFTLGTVDWKTTIFCILVVVISLTTAVFFFFLFSRS